MIMKSSFQCIFLNRSFFAFSKAYFAVEAERLALALAFGLMLACAMDTLAVLTVLLLLFPLELTDNDLSTIPILAELLLCVEARLLVLGLLLLGGHQHTLQHPLQLVVIYGRRPATNVCVRDMDYWSPLPQLQE